MKYYNVYYLIRVDGDEVEQFIDLFANNAKRRVNCVRSL